MAKKLDNTKQMFSVNGVTYTQTKTGYFFKTTGKQDAKGQDITVRIGAAVYEQAFEKYINQKTDEAEAQEWENEMQEAKEEAKRAQEESDKEAEEAMNGKASVTGKEYYHEMQGNKKTPKKESKPRRSKDVAYEANGVTLTQKQVDFLHEVFKTTQWSEGTGTIWCDVLCDEIGGQFAEKPMTVGAMISTLREKHLVEVVVDRVSGHKAKCMGLSSLGNKVVAGL